MNLTVEIEKIIQEVEELKQAYKDEKESVDICNNVSISLRQALIDAIIDEAMNDGRN